MFFSDDVQLPVENEVKQCLFYFPELMFTSSSAFVLERLLKKSPNMHSETSEAGAFLFFNNTKLQGKKRIEKVI